MEQCGLRTVPGTAGLSIVTVDGGGGRGGLPQGGLLYHGGHVGSGD